MYCAVNIVTEKDADEISLQLSELELQLYAFQSEFATKYVVRSYCMNKLHTEP